jgi:glycosyltransferase involved in cell wall biosynthesis
LQHSRPRRPILSLPAPLAGNPYQELLYRHLGSVSPWRCGEAPRWPGARTFAGTRGILHVHWVFARAGHAPGRALKAWRIRRLLRLAASAGWPLVWTAHNLEPHDPTPAEAALAGEVARLASAIIAMDRAAAAALAAAGRPEVHVIPHGHFRETLPEAPGRERARETLGLSNGLPLFLAPGRAAPYKGTLELVRTFARSGLEARLHVAGEPAGEDLAAALRSAAGSDSRIRLELERIPAERLALLLRAADWCVLPYRRVTTSGAMILALGQGVPVIIPEHAGLREYAPGAAAETFSHPADLEWALHRALRRDLSPAREAARLATDRLAWEPIARAHDRLFEAVLQGKEALRSLLTRFDAGAPPTGTAQPAPAP